MKQVGLNKPYFELGGKLTRAYRQTRSRRNTQTPSQNFSYQGIQPMWRLSYVIERIWRFQVYPWNQWQIDSSHYWTKLISDAINLEKKSKQMPKYLSKLPVVNVFNLFVCFFSLWANSFTNTLFRIDSTNYLNSD